MNTLFLALDGSAIIRAVRSCASLNYFPTIATGAVGVSAAVSVDAGVRRNGMFLGNGSSLHHHRHPGRAGLSRRIPAVRPVRTGGAAVAARLGGGQALRSRPGEGGHCGPAGDITTRLVLEGLWRVKNEKLGGLGPGVSFVQDQPAEALECYYPIQLDAKGFSAPIGSKVECFGGNPAGAGPAPPQPQTRHPRWP